MIQSFNVRYALYPLLVLVLRAADYPAPVEGDWTVSDFRFHTGEVLPRLRLHYTTVGKSSGEPVVILHGTALSGRSFLNDQFGGELFAQGQPLDASRYFIVLPDAIGAGKSSKPSDGLRAGFPHYTYDDIVRAQYRLITEHLRLRHLRLVMGESAGGMQTWIWGEMYPGFMDALVPMESQPAPVAGRNWMMRRMIIDAIRNDPEWRGGNYERQPTAFRTALVYNLIATTGGALNLHRIAPTREKADLELNRRLAQLSTIDANDLLYQTDASRDYDPSSDLEKIQARLIAINSADDERNPPELGVMEPAIQRIRSARYILLPIGPESRGHGTASNAKLYEQYIAELMSAGAGPQ